MASHKLGLEIPTVFNTCILKLFDASIYTNSLPIDCPKLNITVPGFEYSVELEFVPNSSITLTACNLDLQTEDCGEQYVNIPDGIYVIKYSVSPNEYVYVEYNHLRISKALNLYKEKLCELSTNCQDLITKTTKFNKLQEIRLLLDAAKAKVEVCHLPSEGMVIYNHALTLLKKMDCKTC